MRRNNKKRRYIQQKENNDKKLICILCILVIILLLIFSTIIIFNNLKNNNFKISNVDTNNHESIVINSADLKQNESDITFTLAAIGDIMCHNTQYWDAYNKTINEYDFSYVFNDISHYTKTADITIGSLETSFAGADRGYSNYPTFNSPDNLAYSIKNIGVDVLSTAGNHCLDMGFSGLSRTIDVLDQADISHLGTYKSKEEQDEILFKYVKGVKIAFINYTYGTNGISIPQGKEFCVNLIDEELIKKHIKSAREQNADVIVACMHWGTEYKTTANSEQEELSDFLFQNGVDIILGNHPHVLEQMEKRTITLEDGTTKDGFVIYALGNFICDQNSENTRNSIILNLTITKHTDGKITIDKANYTPIYMYKNSNLSIRKMKLLDIEKTISNYENGTDISIGQSNYTYLKNQLDKIINIVGKEIN